MIEVIGEDIDLLLLSSDCHIETDVGLHKVYSTIAVYPMQHSYCKSNFRMCIWDSSRYEIILIFPMENIYNIVRTIILKHQSFIYFRIKHNIFVITNIV